MSFVKFENVDLAYAPGGALAIQDVSLDVKEGEFVAVVGPSGCGKSTLMKLISGLRMPSGGYVYVDGRQVGGPLKIVGMAFQNSNLLPWRTTLDNVMLPLEIVEPYRSTLKKERVRYEAEARQLLAKVGLAGFEDKFPWELSGGMQKRVGLARAIAAVTLEPGRWPPSPGCCGGCSAVPSPPKSPPPSSKSKQRRWLSNPCPSVLVQRIPNSWLRQVMPSTVIELP